MPSAGRKQVIVELSEEWAGSLRQLYRQVLTMSMDGGNIYCQAVPCVAACCTVPFLPAGTGSIDRDTAPQDQCQSTRRPIEKIGFLLFFEQSEMGPALGKRGTIRTYH